MKGFNVALAIATLTLSLAGGCKKDEATTSPANPNNSGNCNFTTDVIAADGATRNIIRAVCHVLGSSYFAEFHTDTNAAPTGIAMIFSGTTRPAPGTYTIVTDVSQVAAGKVFVEYYDPASAWIGTTGTITVATGGSQVVITFCSLTLAGVNTKVVSVRATTNL
jgi:hypothetical protein